MKYSYADYVPLFKAFADETRLKIVDLLTCGEMCACELLENFNITQPTLSYHMKILSDSGIVKGRRNGTWMYYSNNGEVIDNISNLLFEIRSNKDKCMSKDDGNIQCSRKCCTEAGPPNK